MIHSASLIFSYSCCCSLDLLCYTIITITLSLDVLVSMTHETSYAYDITQKGGVHHWVFEPSFPSFCLPYDPKPTLRSVS